MSGRLWQTWTSSFSASTGDFAGAAALSGPQSTLPCVEAPPDGSVALTVVQRSAGHGGQQQGFMYHACLHCLSCIWGRHCAAFPRADPPKRVPAPAAIM